MRFMLIRLFGTQFVSKRPKTSEHGPKSRPGDNVTDSAYAAVMNVIQNDEAPGLYFPQTDLATWSEWREALGCFPIMGIDETTPSNFAFPPSAIIKRKPLSRTARRAGWVGCNFALNSESFRGWTLDVLNIVRRLVYATLRRDKSEGRATRVPNISGKSGTRKIVPPMLSHPPTFTRLSASWKNPSSFTEENKGNKEWKNFVSFVGFCWSFKIPLAVPQCGILCDAGCLVSTVNHRSPDFNLMPPIATVWRGLILFERNRRWQGSKTYEVEPCNCNHSQGR